MICIENFEVMGWEHVIRGMRNPMNSWKKSDSYYDDITLTQTGLGQGDRADYHIGPNDLNLMKRLRNAGADHRKFMRMITVYADITAPLYWWKEADTYRIGVEKNSCSTMHKIADKEFTLDDFSHEHLLDDYFSGYNYPIIKFQGNECFDDEEFLTPLGVLEKTIAVLNVMRLRYLKTKNKLYWWQLIQLLPSSYNQKRTVMMNYEVLCNFYHSRKGHKLGEWNEFCSWIEKLPNSELITGERNDSKCENQTG